MTKPARREIFGRWSSFGEHMQALAYAFLPGMTADPRLVRAPTGAGEVDPSAGGFLVETTYATELVGIAYEEAVLAPLCDRRETKTRIADVKVPAIDETSRQDGSRWGGALAYWSTEGGQVSTTFPRFKNLAFSGKKLVAVVVVSTELLKDVPMLEAHVRRAFAAELGFKLDLALLSGTGAGVPMGILSSPALITAAKQTGQAAKTILSQNVRDMWSRLPAPSRRRAVWLVNEDMDSALEGMIDVVGTAGAASVEALQLYMPAGTGGSPVPLMKGRPVLVMEQCPQMGTVGDIVLVDPSHYVLIDGGINPVLSVDVKFLTDEAVFRFVLRVDGQGAFASPITPYNGSSTRSPFVALAAR